MRGIANAALNSLHISGGSVGFAIFAHTPEYGANDPVTTVQPTAVSSQVVQFRDCVTNDTCITADDAHEPYVDQRFRAQTNLQ